MAERRRGWLASAALRAGLSASLIYAIGAGLAFYLGYRASVAFMLEQARATLDAEVEGLREQYARTGLDGLIETIETRIRAAPDRESLYLLLDPRGRRVIGNLSRPPERPSLADPRKGGEARFDVYAPEPRAAMARRYRIETALGGAAFELWVGREIESLERLAARLRWLAISGAGASAALAFGVNALFARRVSRRLDRMNSTAARIVAGDLSQRIAPAGGRDEFDDLARNLDAMLDKIEALMRSTRQVTDHVAHDLRTPLTRLRARAERAAAASRDPEAAEALRACVEDADGLMRTFDALLQIARLEAGGDRGRFAPVDLAAVASDVVELYEPVASEAGASLELEIAARPTTPGQPQLLAQALANLVDNALCHGRPSGRVRVRVDEGPAEGPVLAVTDDGPGVPEERRAEALARFGRLDAERSKPGAGLGLDLASAIARLHGARLELDDAEPGLIARIAFEQAGARDGGSNR